jgi:hypothetical protein
MAAFRQLTKLLCTGSERHLSARLSELVSRQRDEVSGAARGTFAPHSSRSPQKSIWERRPVAVEALRDQAQALVAQSVCRGAGDGAPALDRTIDGRVTRPPKPQYVTQALTSAPQGA